MLDNRSTGQDFKRTQDAFPENTSEGNISSTNFVPGTQPEMAQFEEEDIPF